MQNQDQGLLGCTDSGNLDGPPSTSRLPCHHAALDSEPIQLWFELSYAQYLTIPRSVLQSMPVEWQRRFVACLEELDAAVDWRPKDGQYWVIMRRAGRNTFLSDPFMDYRRGRRKVPVRDIWGPQASGVDSGAVDDAND